MKLWVDADSCPTQVRDLIIRFALRLSIQVCFAANRVIPFTPNPLFAMFIADDNPDAADNLIVESAQIGDLVVTRDIPLASRLVKKNIRVINDRGVVFTQNNINEKLAIRNLHYDLFALGLKPEKSHQYGKKELNAFANSLDRELALVKKYEI